MECHDHLGVRNQIARSGEVELILRLAAYRPELLATFSLSESMFSLQCGEAALIPAIEASITSLLLTNL